VTVVRGELGTVVREDWIVTVFRGELGCDSR
jgi:hypothetical protein